MAQIAATSQAAIQQATGERKDAASRVLVTKIKVTNNEQDELTFPLPFPPGFEIRGKDFQQPVMTYRSIYSKDVRFGILEAHVGSLFVSFGSNEVRFWCLDSAENKLFVHLKSPPAKLHLKQTTIESKDDPTHGILSRACVICVEFTDDTLLSVEQFMGQLSIIDRIFKQKEALKNKNINSKQLTEKELYQEYLKKTGASKDLMNKKINLFNELFEKVETNET